MTLGQGIFSLQRSWLEFNGAITDVRVYDRILDPAEITELTDGPLRQ